MDLTTFAGVMSALQLYGYLIMFILMFFEGSLIVYIAAFAASLGLFNIYWVTVLSILGNSLGDLPYIMIGRLSRKPFVKKYFKMLGLKRKIGRRIEKSLKRHTGKTIALIKIIPGLPAAGLTFAGSTNISLKKLFIWSFLISIPYSILFVLLGFYSGVTFRALSAYFKIGETAVVLLFVIIIVILIIKRVVKEYVQEVE